MRRNCESDVITLSDEDNEENGKLSSSNSGTNNNNPALKLAKNIKLHDNSWTRSKTKTKIGVQPKSTGITMSILNEQPLDLDALFNKPKSSLHSQRQVIEHCQQIASQIQDHSNLGQQGRTSGREFKRSMIHLNWASSPPKKASHFDFDANMERIQLEHHIRKLSRNAEDASIASTSRMESGLAATNASGNNRQQQSVTKQFNEPINLFCDTYTEAYDKKSLGIPAVEDEFNGYFECTYQSCGKRLKNNIQFMYHIWAHVVRQKWEEEDPISNLQIEQASDELAGQEEQRSDVHRLHTCNECLWEQPSPYRMQLHYSRVHKRGPRPLLESKPHLRVCNICETVLQARDMPQHIEEGHIVVQNRRRYTDLFYVCRFANGGKKCRYSASNRNALIQHFYTKHRGTHVLICPFCLTTFPVPSAAKRNSRVAMPTYISHMIRHDIERTHRSCGRCVLNFPRSAPDIDHGNQHLKSGERKWMQWKSKNTHNIEKTQPKKSVALVNSEVLVQQCLECHEGVKSFKAHLSECRKCDFCDYRTRCENAMRRHLLLSTCNSTNITRQPFASSAQIMPNRDRNCTLQCVSCQLPTLDVQTAMEHVTEGKCNGAYVCIIDSTNTIRLAKGQQDEEWEAEKFGITQMGDAEAEIDEKLEGMERIRQTVDNEERRVIEQLMAEMVPQMKVIEVMTSKEWIHKLLLRDGCNLNPEETARDLRLAMNDADQTERRKICQIARQ